MAITSVTAQENRTLYQYDGLGRLVTETRPQEGGETVFTYDALGNRLTAIDTTLFAPELSVAATSSTEGGMLVFTVSKAGPTNASVSVDYATSNGSAETGDYQGLTGTLTFAPLEFAKTVSVQTIQDSVYEDPETMLLTLSSPSSGASIAAGEGEAAGTITDNDTAPSFSINNGQSEEGQNIGFYVRLSTASGATHRINYATADNTAKAPSDYRAKSGTITFAPGETQKLLVILGVEDSVGEPTENFRVNLSNATNSASISDSQGIGYITNDDNFAPTANNDTYNNVTFGSWRTFYPLGNDTDPEGHSLTISNVWPQHGTAQIINNGTAVRHICTSCTALEDQITYSISDGHGGSDSATIYVNFSTGGGGGGLPPLLLRAPTPAEDGVPESGDISSDLANDNSDTTGGSQE